MATSGTTAFALSRDDLIAGALRLCKAYGPNDPIPAEDTLTCAQALNILTKELSLEGLPLHCIQEVSVPMLASTASYNLSTASSSTLPLRVLDCFIRDADGNDTMLTSVSRWDDDQLSSKTAEGLPNQYYYNPQLGAGTIIVRPVPPTTGTHTLHVVIQRQLQDFNLAADNPDFPQEAFRLLKWCLADEIALEYHCPIETRREINQKAAGYKDKFFASQQEQTSMYFQPSTRG